MKQAICLAVILISFAAFSKASIDDIQQANSSYLKEQEKKGYHFRSQIITEFDSEHSRQEVNLKLEANVTYQLIARGDDDIADLELAIKNIKKSKMIELVAFENEENVIGYQFSPAKSGRYKIMMEVQDFTDHEKGFVSFMVLKK
ncbi:MAG: hypothetical protein KI790_06340 [Cyclobacteriaceae bacterium]|nr:hypothetical protein [Cyclobacteriaceae bacterium HetDA_MAG_MS6]